MPANGHYVLLSMCPADVEPELLSLFPPPVDPGSLHYIMNPFYAHYQE
jgi:hypothetical protein